MKNQIGRHVYLSPDIKIGTNCQVRDYATLGPKVILANNIIIGSYAKINNISIGDNSHIETGVICTGYGEGKIEIGRESYIGVYNILDWSSKISIGNYVHIAGPSTGIWTHSSVGQAITGLSLRNKDPKYRPTAQISIQDNVYIGGNCTIYPGITIGHHSIVTPNSVVTKDIKPYSMVGGVPAKFIKNIYDEYFN
ncbi:MAG: hypothetical protein K9J13_10455 [Saprospiraceae bacterium]|nr:hypothetical protein [Saprospiraceae bacterium]